MSRPEPITLRGTHETLVPLPKQYHDDLVEAVKDGELWKLWCTVVPEPGKLRVEIHRRLALRAKGAMLPIAVISDSLGNRIRHESSCSYRSDNIIWWQRWLLKLCECQGLISSDTDSESFLCD